ncbi:MAG: ABC transporter ATP-binding protein [Phototrophicales bacterium]|nr:MAG: ABC transporter ATP-binding protein [Phototrophicales bacterium]
MRTWMMAVLSVCDVTIHFGWHMILNKVSFDLEQQDRVGLVGANGVGKSTLLNIIVGALEPDRGTVRIGQEARLGYLRQVQRYPDDMAIEGVISAITSELTELEQRIRQLEIEMANKKDAELDGLFQEYGDLSERFERLGGYDYEHRLEIITAGLHIDHFSRDRQWGTLSGGEQARWGLAGLLLSQPDVLLLDEPTNHLDVTSLEWLEDYLQGYRGAILVVSHDRHFLNRTVNRIIEIDEHHRGAVAYSGNYESYRAAKALERQQRFAAYTAQQEEIRSLRAAVSVTARRNDNYRTHTDNDKFIVNFKKSQHEQTVSKRVQEAKTRLERLLADPIPPPPEDLTFKAPLAGDYAGFRIPIRVEQITKGYDDRLVIDNISFEIRTDSRVLLVGENGAGKTTLLDILAGLTKPDKGSVLRNPGLKVGYLQQSDHLPDEWDGLTMFEAYCHGIEAPRDALQAQVIRTGLFRYTDFDKPVDSLSSGELRKLFIGRMIAMRPHVFILDEPTNHVSLDVIDGLEQALRMFSGAVIAASHDRYFISHFEGEIWEISGGQLIRKP